MRILIRLKQSRVAEKHTLKTSIGKITQDTVRNRNYRAMWNKRYNIGKVNDNTQVIDTKFVRVNIDTKSAL